MPDPNFTTVSSLESVITRQDMAQATDDSYGESLEADTSIVKDHLAYAESRVESYLIEYDLEVIRDEAPPAVVWAVLFIASYTLFQRADLTVSDSVRESYQEALTWLQEVRRGEATVPGVSSYDKTFVGFGDTSTMIIDRIPHSDSIPTL